MIMSENRDNFVVLWIEADGVLWEARALGVAIMQGLLDMKVTGFPGNKSIVDACLSLAEYFPHKSVDHKTIADKMDFLWPLVRPCPGALEALCQLYERIERETGFKIKLIVDNEKDFKNTLHMLLDRLDENSVLSKILRGLQFFNSDDFINEFKEEDYLATVNPSKLIVDLKKVHGTDMKGSLVSGPDKTGFKGLDNMKYLCSIEGAYYEMLPLILQTEPIGVSYRVSPLERVIKDGDTKSLWSTVKKVEKRSSIGKVVPGFKRGSKDLGIPTANLEIINLEEGVRLVESTGVYAGFAQFTKWSEVHQKYMVPEGESRYPYVMSVGFNPYYEGNALTIEPYLFHEFTDDFYGRHLEIDVLYMLRPMSNYVRFDQLVKAIQMDCELAYSLLLADNDPD